MKKSIPAILVALSAIASVYAWYYTSDSETAKRAVRYRLIDGTSAEFRNVYVTPSGFICGEVNSKNRFGAYAGFTQFVAPPGAFELMRSSLTFGATPEDRAFIEKFCG